MRSLYIDPSTYDIVVQNRQLRFTETVTEWLSAKLEARLKTFAGEWFANVTVGVPYFEQILKKQADIDNVQAIFGNVIKNTTGVKELLSFDIAFDGTTRTYSYSFNVLADTGEEVGGEGTL